MTTKHDLILSYIEQLPVGEKISVRGIAKQLQVSEGTAYRAIKEAENSGLVSTIQRVGTIRIERKLKKNIEKTWLSCLFRGIYDGTCRMRRRTAGVRSRLRRPDARSVRPL